MLPSVLPLLPMSRILCILGPSNAVVRGDNNTCALRMEKHRECTAISEIDAGRSGGNNTVLESSQGTRDCFAQLFELNTTCVEQIDTCVKKADEKSCHHESKLYDRVNCILQTEHQCSYYPVMASRDYFPSVVFPPDSRVFCPLDRAPAACYKGSREDQVRCLARECFVSLGDRAYEFAHQAENCIAKAVQQCFNKAAQIALSRAQRFEERVECTASEIETQCKNFNFQFPIYPLGFPNINMLQFKIAMATTFARVFLKGLGHGAHWILFCKSQGLGPSCSFQLVLPPSASASWASPLTVPRVFAPGFSQGSHKVRLKSFLDCLHWKIFTRGRVRGHTSGAVPCLSLVLAVRRAMPLEAY